MAYQRVEIAVDSDDESPLLPPTINYEPNRTCDNTRKKICSCCFYFIIRRTCCFYFIIGIFVAFFLAILHFFAADVSFIMCGLFLVLDIFAYRHFIKLLDLKRTLDVFGTLHNKFKNEKDKLLFENNRLQATVSYLQETCDSSENANEKRCLNVRQLKELQTKLQGVNMNKIAGITSIRNRLNQFQKKWS
eukprot:468033_1